MRERLFIWYSVLLVVLALVALPAAAQEQGFYAITSTPWGADTYLDGQFYGETPLTIPVPPTPQTTHTIKVMHPGYMTFTQTYPSPGSGQTVPLTISLVPSGPTGGISVTSNPPGGVATVDGGNPQVTPTTFDGLLAGYHIVTVTYPGYPVFSANVLVSGGTTTPVQANLGPQVAPGFVSTDSVPPGADVYIDGLYRGQTPMVVGGIVPGQHIADLRLAGYLDYNKTVNVDSGQITVLSATLVATETFGSISVQTVPPGAELYLDGSYQGNTFDAQGFDIIGVSSGVHNLTVHLNGYQDLNTQVQVVARQPNTVTYTLTPVSRTPPNGTLSIISNPSGADVYLNNVYKGVSPLTLTEVPPGNPTVQIKLASYQDYSSTVTIAGGQVTQVQATLTKTAVPTTSAAPTTTKTPLPIFAIIGALVGAGLLAKGRARSR